MDHPLIGIICFALTLLSYNMATMRRAGTPSRRPARQRSTPRRS